MAQKSTTILASKSHISNVTGTDISFTATGTEYKISSTSTSLAGFNVRDLITVTGTSNNNSTFTVKSEVSANELRVEEVVTTETADGSTTTTLDHTGFVSGKVKGDGYYSKPDGVHTVAYQVNSTMTGSIKMQGSLATTPSEDDFFDITGTTFTADQSTLISTANFTGNFVWIRAKATSVTDGTISSILVNS
mgnify:CR=1 FL=1|jgi:hypothetical protein|tara:strand:+ start:465 stop:1040 length:576 start_codon:yes stop_codon:yes gene_type:complete